MKNRLHWFGSLVLHHVPGGSAIPASSAVKNLNRGER
jgi:hypothetical protein